ncbi:metallopeptidase family protein [Quadrisphaera oryzae]|uniref:metallopeptidase family protein n=1 Tax=Quadrisphaera sp. RL12-1S TaxID=2763011 RepID=UPI00351C043B
MPSARGVRRRRRDRHGRGLRGPLMPPELPGTRTRAERFDDVVLDAVERLERRWAEPMAAIEFAVEDVPPGDSAAWERPEVALGRFFPATRTQRARIVLYRRPLETRGTDEADLAALVHEVVVEQVAAATGMTPEQVDPRYRPDDD